jgi:hypothetical protein
VQINSKIPILQKLILILLPFHPNRNLAGQKDGTIIAASKRFKFKTREV